MADSRRRGREGGESDTTANKSQPKRARVEYSLEPFFMNQWLDVLAPEKKWLEAQICELLELTDMSGKRVQQKIKLHYKGFHSRYDEYLMPHMSDHDRGRIAPLHTHTLRPACYGRVAPLVGTQLDAQDTLGSWLAGRIKAVNPNTRPCQVLIEYEGWPNFDEWLNYDSPRLAPLNAARGGGKPLSCEDEKAQQPVAMDCKPGSVPRDATRPNAGAQQRGKDEKQTVASTEEDEKFQLLLRSKFGYLIHQMDKDGNCLFRSVSHQMYGTPVHHAIVRAKCCDYMAKQAGYFRSFVADDIDSYIARLKTDGEWGDHLEIQAMCEIYDRAIEIFAYSSVPIRFGRAPSVTVRPIRLSYHSNSHYNSVTDAVHAPLSTAEPGLAEEARIRMVTARPSELQRARMMSDAEATNQEALNQALALSRLEFQNRLKSGLPGSLCGDSSLEDATLKAALQSSLKELEDWQSGQATETLRVSREQYEQTELKRAIDQSLASRTASLGAGLAAAPGFNAMELDDPELHIAILNSLAPHALTLPPAVGGAAVASVHTMQPMPAAAPAAARPTIPASPAKCQAEARPAGPANAADSKTAATAEAFNRTRIGHPNSPPDAILAPLLRISGSVGRTRSNPALAAMQASGNAVCPAKVVISGSSARSQPSCSEPRTRSEPRDKPKPAPGLTERKRHSPMPPGRTTSSAVLLSSQPQELEAVYSALDQTEWPLAVQQCHAAGFPLPRCIQAYALFSADSSLTAQQIAHKMEVYLSSSMADSSLQQPAR